MSILRILGILLAILFLVILYLGTVYLLPYPWSKLNTVLAALIIIMLWQESGTVVWLAFLSHLFIELYAASPFGVILLSGAISILLAYWLFQHIFTNKSWYAALTLGFSVILIYRILYIAILTLLFLFNFVEEIPWKLIFITSGWEILFTTLIITTTYLILSRFSKRLTAAVLEPKLTAAVLEPKLRKHRYE